ncbi:MAG: amino acid adenylation domain-containing protein [Iphinoe sp. HA4291-MV1]|nr:amino acid adenylation domain-containing protein [Iphinoe sp. HA4291-MV1]
MQSTIGNGFRISPQQKHLWVLQQSDRSQAYYSQIAIRIQENFAPEILKAVLENIIKRQEILRTVFNCLPEMSIPLQFVTENSMLMFEERDLSSLTSQEQKIEIDALFQDRRWQTFDFGKEPLLYTVLSKLSSCEQILFISLPAVCADLLTLHNLVKEICHSYGAYLHGRELSDESMQYADISAWLNELLESEDTEIGRKYWQRDVFSALSWKIPLENHSSAKVRFEPQSLTLEINSDTVTKLEMLASKYDTSISVFLLACWQIQLWRFTEQSDIVVGTASDGRKYPELEDVLGLLTKYLPIHSYLEENLRFRELLKKVEETLSYGNKWQEYFSWEEVAAKNGNGTEPPFFPFCFDFQEQSTNCVVDDIIFSVYNQYTCIDRFRVKLSGVCRDDRLLLEFHYDSNLFPLKNIQILSEQYLTLLESAINHPDEAIADLEMCSDRERQRLLIEFNDPKIDYPQEKCIHQLFEEQVERTPEAVAVVFENQQLIYRELNNRANQLAHYLKTLGVGAETLVGIYVERSLDMVIGLLAVLKAGGAYLPLDPNDLSERLVYMLQDAQVSVLLTQQKLQKNLTNCQVNVIHLDTDWEKIAHEANDNPNTQVKPENLAYVIYTSGSTGLPKGVAIEHRQLFNYLNSIQTVLNLPADANYAIVSTIAADLGHTVIFPSLCSGGCLHIISSERITNAKGLADYFHSNSIDCLKIVPSHLRALLTSEAGSQILTPQRLVLGGESTSWELIKQIQQLAPESQIINHYGPTETTVGVLTYQVEGVPDTRQSSTVPIGHPLSNTQIYILDSKKQPTPIGVPGELHIGGAGLARGYLNRPQLTAEKFIPNPFSDDPQSRLYKTGDLARYLSDGNIEYIGRIDNQVKIRGFRIELGEIEAVLSQYPHVQQVTVIKREDTPDDKRLVAYLVSDAEHNPSISDLRQFLKQKLPEYMVPAAFVYLDALPLTPNGKLDRRALKAPEVAQQLTASFVAPRTPIEEMLANIWVNVLSIRQVGIYDNFFDIGGDSIRGIQVQAQAQKMGLEFSLQQLFQYQTIHELAQNLIVVKPELLSRLKTELFGLIFNEDRKKLPDDVEDAYPLSMLQAGVIFHLESGSNYEVHNQNIRLQSGSGSNYEEVYIQSVRLRGRFEPESFRQALQLLVNRHAILRTSFDLANFSEPLQLVHRTSIIPLQVDDLRHLDFTEQENLLNAWLETEKRRKFDWGSHPFVRFYVHCLSEETFQLTFSYLFLDGWSSASMLTELAHHYIAFLRGQTPIVEASPKTSYRDFVALERMALKSDQSKQFWTQKLMDCNPTVLAHWPARSTQNTQKPKTLPFRVPVPIATEVLEGLKNLASRTSVPLKSVLLAGHLRVIGLLSGQSDVVTGLLVNGRPEAEDGDRVLGLFLNFLPLRLKFGGGTWLDLVKATFEAECDLLPHRRYPLAELHRHNGRQLWFETIFNFINFHIYQSLEGFSEIELLDFRNKSDQTFFPLSAYFVLDSFTSELTLYLDVQTSDFCDEQLEAIAGYYLRIFTQMANDPDECYELQNLLSAEEKHQLLVEWNDTQTQYPQDKCIYQLFEEQVERTPEAVAVVFENQQLTYRELNARANQLAHYLKTLGVGAETLVGICVERSLEMVVGLLGILKAGGAYIPLDPNYPPERLAYILGDAQVSVMLTQQYLQIPKHNTQVVYLDTDWSKIATCSESNFPSDSTTAENLAYVIYTSGSTGQPKGVQVLNRSVVNFLMSMCEHLGLTNQDIFLGTTSVSFDIAVLEIFLPISLGGCLVLVSREIASDGLQLSDYLVKSGATVMQGTPATWQLLLNAEWHGSQRLKILCGGEALPQKLARQLLERGASLWNMYGPTETTIWSAVYEVTFEDDLIYIGHPIANTQIYLLDPHLQPVPIGVPGELHIGGVGLALGYLNQPNLTALKFIPNPFSNEPGSRLYKTGDLARYLPNGKLEFLGRIDQQVKIRGFRIELGEIETVLAQDPRVRETVVVAREDDLGDKRLVAYVVPNQEQPLTVEELRSFLKEKLPEYMVPSAFVTLDALPLTASGKIDRRALPAPTQARPELEKTFVAPRNHTEETVARIWAEAFRIDKVGVHDNFFDLGGHSLLVTQIVFQLREVFQVDLPLQCFFETPTVAGIAQAIEVLGRTDTGAVTDIIEIADINAETILEPTIYPEAVAVEHITASSIFLTGATGFLGAFLLHELLEQTQAHIYCLVRSLNAEEAKKKIQRNLELYSLWQEDLSSRIIPVVGDLSQPLLGLSAKQFQMMASEIDVIYHNGASTNHIYPYSVLKAANVLGTQEVLKLACQTKVKPVHHISTISVFQFVSHPAGTIIQEQDNLEYSYKGSRFGYTASKWVAEKLVMTARSRGLPVCIYRPERISGDSQTGACQTDDFLWRMIKACIQVGSAPDLDVRWGMTPVDYVSKAIVHLSLQPESIGKAFHLFNPHPIHMSKLVDWIRARSYPLKQILPDKWRAELISIADHSSENAAYSLLPLFSEKTFKELISDEFSSVQFDCQNTLDGLAGTSIVCPPINDQLLDTYFSYFTRIGFLDTEHPVSEL